MTDLFVSISRGIGRGERNARQTIIQAWFGFPRSIALVKNRSNLSYGREQSASGRPPPPLVDRPPSSLVIETFPARLDLEPIIDRIEKKERKDRTAPPKRQNISYREQQSFPFIMRIVQESLSMHARNTSSRRGRSSKRLKGYLTLSVECTRVGLY